MAKALAKTNTATSYHAVDFEDLLFVYDGTTLQVLDHTNQDAACHDAIFFIGWFKDKMLEDEALALALYARSRNIPFRNSEVGLTRSNSKLSQCVSAVIHGVQTTPFVFAQDSKRLLEGIDNSALQYPMIVKAVRAARGNYNFLVRSRAELIAILDEHPDIPCMAQTFVPNDGDYRLLVMGGKVHMAIHRQSQTDSHINNTSQGGIATEVSLEALPPAMLEQAGVIATALNREITGVDMIVDRNTGKHYFLEANNMPQLSTGSLVEDKIRILSSYLTDWLNDEQP